MKDKTTKTAEIAISYDVPGMKALIESKKAEIAHISASSYKTAGSFPERDIQSIETEKDVAKLIDLVAATMHYENAYNQAAATLDLSTYPACKINGALPSDIISDCKLRIAIVQNETKINAIQDIEKELASYMTKEDKLRLMMETVKNL